MSFYYIHWLIHCFSPPNDFFIPTLNRLLIYILQKMPVSVCPHFHKISSVNIYSKFAIIHKKAFFIHTESQPCLWSKRLNHDLLQNTFKSKNGILVLIKTSLKFSHSSVKIIQNVKTTGPYFKIWNIIYKLSLHKTWHGCRVSQILHFFHQTVILKRIISIHILLVWTLA